MKTKITSMRIGKNQSGDTSFLTIGSEFLGCNSWPLYKSRNFVVGCCGVIGEVKSWRGLDCCTESLKLSLPDTSPAGKFPVLSLCIGTSLRTGRRIRLSVPNTCWLSVASAGWVCCTESWNVLTLQRYRKWKSLGTNNHRFTNISCQLKTNFEKPQIGDTLVKNIRFRI